MLLEVKGLCVNYGRIEAMHGISFTVDEGEIVTLIGANGAGKTTTMETISGLRARVRAGPVVFDGHGHHQLPSHERRGRWASAQSPEGRGIFPGMTVMENLEMGAYTRPDRKSKAVKDDLERVFELFPRLKERSKQAAGTLSGGEQQMLAIGRALMARPKLLLLDEPSMGLAPMLIQQIFDIITEINSAGHHDPARRAERGAGAQAVAPRLHPRDRARSSGRAPARTSPTTRRSRRPTSAATSRSGPVPRGRTAYGIRSGAPRDRSWCPASYLRRCGLLFRRVAYGRSVCRVTSGLEQEE